MNIQNSCRLLPNRGGLTLLELLVVLTILIAIGGIVVASLPGLLERTQSATAAANVPEIDAALKRKMIVDQGQIGNRFDSLVTGTTGLNGEVASYVGGLEIFETRSLSDAEVEALADLGITELIPANESANDATFDSHNGQPVVISPETNVCAISSEYSAPMMQQLWNLQVDAQTSFIVFGLGARCSLVGAGPSAVFSEAPVHFSDNSQSNPKDMYSRYLIVVELKLTNQSLAQARYIGTGIPGPTGLKSVGQEIQEFYSRQN